MTNEIRQRLLEVLRACRAIGRYSAGRDFTAYENNDVARVAVERRFDIR